jgi:transaldolase
MLEHLSKEKKICLVAVDFAGFTTNPSIKKKLGQNKAII